jgi:hypothetical protein
LQPPPETNASVLPGATRLYPHQRAIVDAIGDPESGRLSMWSRFLSREV